MRSKRCEAGFVLLGILVVISAFGGGHLLMMRSRVKPPAAAEFGLGPRASAAHLYTATLTPEEPLRPRKMQALRVTVLDADGQAVEAAEISVDGGMPQHGHGLPTRPRVTRNTGNGVYEIEGVRFNMGGWWEFKLSIASAAGADVVTFNLDL